LVETTARFLVLKFLWMETSKRVQLYNEGAMKKQQSRSREARWLSARLG
jgi:hypothetical protein